MAESTAFEQAALSRVPQDEVISVYEVIVKDDGPGLSQVAASGAIAAETATTTGNPEYQQQQQQQESVMSSPTPKTPQNQLTQANCALDLQGIDVIDADVIDDSEDLEDLADDSDAVLVPHEQLEGDSTESEILGSTTKVSEENNGTNNQPSPTQSNIIDKDDPRSRLHYVKYLKRDGKTLKIWECGICTKEFRHQYTLMRHLPTHTDERNFKCETCGKAFRQLSTLSQHKAIHSDARPYICEFCQKTFNRVSTLISHRKTHSEHKPHKCHLCGKGFHQKGNLRNHVFTHTNERPYKCDLCGKGFNQMSNLVCHKVKAHAHVDKMQYSCGICGSEFLRRNMLRSHEEHKHGIKYRQTASAQSVANEAKNSKSKNTRAVNRSAPQPNSDVKDFQMTEFMENIIIKKIDTQAMKAALLQGQTPFALFKPAKGIPVLVKVTPSGNSNHLLIPATADDLKVSGKIDSSSAQLSDIDGSKSVQIKVPVVATVIEKVEADGEINFVIEPPGPDQEQDSLLTPLDALSETLTHEEAVDADHPRDRKPDSPLLQPQLPQQQQQQQPSPSSPPSSPPGGPVLSSSPDYSASNEELLELADLGGIQFVRPTEDGRYEVMTKSEARNLMAQNSHDIEILSPEEIGSVLDFDLDRGIPEALGPVAHHCQQPQLQQHPYQHPCQQPCQQSYQQLYQQPYQQHQQEQLLDSGDFLVLDSSSEQKVLSFGDVESLDDKELKQLMDITLLEDRYGADAATFTYLSQAKIDEMFLGTTKPFALEPVDIVENKNLRTIENELPNVLNHRNEIPPITSLLYGRDFSQQQQQQNQHPLSIFHEPVPFFKNNQTTIDDFHSIFTEESSSSVIDYSTLSEYNTRLKFSNFDDTEPIFFS